LTLISQVLVNSIVHLALNISKTKKLAGFIINPLYTNVY
jgi:hypothetical protein